MRQHYITPRQLTSAKGAPGRWPISLATFWRQVAEGLLPTPLVFGPLLRALPLHEIEAIERAINAGASRDERRALVCRLMAARVAEPEPAGVGGAR